MKTKIWNVGILGCGLIARYHARSLTELPQANLLGAYDRDRDTCESFCQSFGTHAFDTAEALLAFPTLDAVCICLPSGLHYETTLACIRAGKHVIVEKPMTFTAAQATDVIAAAKEAGVQVSVISQLRYTDAVAQLKATMEEGWFGTVATVDVCMKYWREPTYYSASNWKGTLKMDGGGALMNQGIHGVDLLRYLAGPVVSVQALAATRCHEIEAEDTVAAVLEFKNGALGTLQATTSVYPGFSRRLEICGSEGTAILQEDSIVYSAFRDPSRRLACAASRHDTGSRPDGMDHTLHKKQIGLFLDALTMGVTPLVDAAEGKKAVELVEAIYTAASTGKKIYLTE